MSSDEVYRSTGRGGAGNIAPVKSFEQPSIVELNPGEGTPYISQEVYTTGRGGAGNMQRNDNPELTRKLQDVERHDEEQAQMGDNDLSTVMSFGRGGYGNIEAARKAENKKKSLFQRAKDAFSHNS